MKMNHIVKQSGAAKKCPICSSTRNNDGVFPRDTQANRSKSKNIINIRASFSEVRWCRIVFGSLQWKLL